MAPGNLGTLLRVPERAVVRLDRADNTQSLVSILYHVSTSLYSLRERAAVQQGERTFIWGSSAVFRAIAAQVGVVLQGDIHVAVDSETEETWLRETLGLPAENILRLDLAPLQTHLRAGQSEPFDVIFDASLGQGVLVSDLYEAAAPHARIIWLGRTDEMNLSFLSMDVLRKGISLISVDMGALFSSKKPMHHQSWKRYEFCPAWNL